VISIRKYLTPHGEDNEATLRRALGLLLQLTEIHAIQGDDADYMQFRSGIHEIASRFSDETPPEEILIMVGGVAIALKEYGERTTRYIKAQGAEYQRMVTMFTDTIAATSHASDRAVGRLTDIKRKLEQACVIEDVRVLRMQLAECLESIREEICAQQAQAAAPAGNPASPSRGPESAPAPPQSQQSDPVTGLPGPPLAAAELEDTAKREAGWYAAVIVAHRLASINSRFGYAVGDRVLRKLAARLRSGFSADDRLFRWSGPSFMALLFRREFQGKIEKELARIIGPQTDELIDIGTRSILLPVSASWAVLPVNAPARVIREKIDKFVALHAQGQ
jgi:GGDEF domain-containing protein